MASNSVRSYSAGESHEEFIERRTRKDETADLWIVPYADFMSTLMVLFLMMFVIAFNAKTEKRYKEIIVSIQKEMGGDVKEEVQEDIREQNHTQQVVMKFDEMVEKQNLERFVTVSYDTEQIKVSLKTPVLFNLGKVDLRPEALSVLKQVANIIRNINNDVIVEGHTDNVPVSMKGKYSSNWELSQMRAVEVIKYFIRVEKLHPKMFAAAGYGEYRPVFLNDTPEHRSQNRRIEINILREKKKVR